MIWQDLVNGLFELFAGFFVLLHCRRLYIDKQVKGVSLIATIFFTSWGFWNLYYYPWLGQWLSFFGGLAIVSANALWIAMMVYYTLRPHGRKPGPMAIPPAPRRRSALTFD
jgi:peptidoglycan biosynthesis protein MviN/MurJ (putative lipid II flippase)